VDETARARELLTEAKKILRVLRVGARRAFVLEVTGTPKAGKTTTLGLLHGFFKQAGYRVYTLRERASDCPIPMKGHFFFNAWTTCTMLSEVLATYDTDVDLIILDRGFFDALIWLGLQVKRDQVSADESAVFTNFVLLERWRSLVDLTIVMTADPNAAMDREGKGVLLPRTGSLMNETSLTAFNEQVKETATLHRDHFRLIQLDTTSNDGAKATTLELLDNLLPIIRTWGEQHVVVVPRDIVKKIFVTVDEKGTERSRPFLHRDDAMRAWAQLQTHMRLELRHNVEQDDSLVQVVGCGIVVHDDSLFLLTRTAKDEKTSYGRSTLWKGCHVEGHLPISLEGVSEQVQNRVLEELHLKTHLDTGLLGMAWSEDSGIESRHMGVLFLARINDTVVAKSMEDKEFRKAGRGHVMVGKFQTPQQILKALSQLDLEPWSHFAAENIGLREPT
jgi:predicted NUDIX family phosphoesterase